MKYACLSTLVLGSALAVASAQADLITVLQHDFTDDADRPDVSGLAPDASTLTGNLNGFLDIVSGRAVTPGNATSLHFDISDALTADVTSVKITVVVDAPAGADPGNSRITFGLAGDPVNGFTEGAGNTNAAGRVFSGGFTNVLGNNVSSPNNSAVHPNNINLGSLRTGDATTLVFTYDFTTADVTVENVTTGQSFTRNAAESQTNFGNSPTFAPYELSDVDNIFIQVSETAGTTSVLGVQSFQVDLDVIPEPGSMMLLGLGGLALLPRRRARQR